MRRLLVIALFFIATASFAGVVQPLGAAPQVLIPAAGSTAGANGTFFHSDISIINLATHDQAVLLQWLPQAGTGSNMTNTFTLPARSGIRSADFVHDYLNTTGLGSIIISGTTAGGDADATATLYVNSRIWTQQPNTNGTTSQSFPAIPLNTINTQVAALFAVGGPDNSANYRVNVGIVNVDPNNTQTFVVQVPQAGGNPQAFIVTVPPMSMQQLALGNNTQPSTQVNIQNATATATRSNLWTAYSSTVDNITGDAWSEMAVAGTTQ
ncbi:MAG TPA: hypothetical protein VLV78_19435 [Thermoanaerobaculia bacterium]|nr:hypothetical protein [Thermoanaerobaculia bacterium]